jgi:hypothetical protein
VLPTTPVEKKHADSKKIRFIAATDKKVYFSEGSNLSPDSAWIEMPLAHALTHGLDDGSLSLFKKKRIKILLIVPDHWFKHEFFLFKSQRDSLIKPFLERKLKTTYPSLPSVHHFFSYTCRQKAAEGPGVKVFHLHEQNAYSLYDALDRTFGDKPAGRADIKR